MLSSFKLFYLICVALLALGVLIVALSSYWFFQRADGRHYDSLEDVPPQRVALLLGTSSRTTRGTPNPFFYARIRAAAALYHAGKISYILASGDNRYQSYNEPQRMQEALIAYGVPQSAIYLDHAGYRTLDSVIRTARIFNLSRYIIVSQREHNIRALYIAQAYGHDAYAYNAPMSRQVTILRFMAREVAARLLTLLDIHLLQREPSVSGPPQPIPSSL